MALAEEISREPRIDCVITLMQIYNEKEQTKQGKIPNVQFKKKKSALHRKCNRTKSWVQGNTKSPEKPDAE